MARYAAQTEVSADRSRSEIERTLMRYGATSFAYGWEGSMAIIAFKAHGKHVRFHLPLPDRHDSEFTQHSRGVRSSEQAEKLWEQACRQRWRALALVVKAKLEAVEAGITTFEDEFMAHVLLTDGTSVGDWMRPQLEEVYRTGLMPPLLPALPAH